MHTLKTGLNAKCIPVSIGYNFCPERNVVFFSVGHASPLSSCPWRSFERELVGLNRVGIRVRLVFVFKWCVYRSNKRQSCIFAWWKLRHSSIFRKNRDIRRPGEALTGTWDRGVKIRDVPGNTGRLATLPVSPTTVVLLYAGVAERTEVSLSSFAFGVIFVNLRMTHWWIIFKMVDGCWELLMFWQRRDE